MGNSIRNPEPLNFVKRFVKNFVYEKRMIYRGDGSIYLERHEFIRIGKAGKYFSIKFHKFHASDDECFHDHPWAFISIILKNGYREHTYENGKRQWIFGGILAGNPKKTERLIKPLSVIYRPAIHLHRVELLKEVEYGTFVDERGVEQKFAKGYKEIPATTLVITFKRVRKWGFIEKLTNRWIHWKEYKTDVHC